MNSVLSDPPEGPAAGTAIPSPYRVVSAPVRTVFLSSTARDLAEYRDAASARLSGMDGYKCIRMEDFGARDGQAAEFCRQKVAECDLVVFVIGHLWGSCPPGDERSYTEIEYDAAVEAQLPRLVFVAPDSFPLRADLIEGDAERAKQRAFRQRVSTDRVRDELTSPAELSGQLVNAIRNWERQNAHESIVLDTQRARQGFSALQELMHQRTAVRDAVLQYRNDLGAVAERLDSVADLKDMHDQLHSLQFHCFDVIVQESRRFPEADACERLEDHALELHLIRERLAQIAGRDPARSVSDNSWIASLERSEQELREALDELDRSKLERVVWSLNRVLNSQPSRINDRLAQAVRELPLAKLVRTLDTLGEQLPALGMDPQKINALQEGVGSLRQLDAQLRLLSSTHDLWQEIDREVRRIDADLQRDLYELRMSWTDLRATTAPLLASNPALAQETERLEEVLGRDDDAAARRAFRRYHRLISTTFYRIDSDLKMLCDQLRRLGGPLTSVLANLE
jgi:hypothetical protein